MMRDRVIAILLLIGAGAILAGCTAPPAQLPPAATTPAMTAAPVTTTAVPQFSFTLGQEYLHKKYSFTSESETFSEQFHVTNDPWAIDFTVNPTNPDPQYTWFEITATNIDSAGRRPLAMAAVTLWTNTSSTPCTMKAPTGLI